VNFQFNLTNANMAKFTDANGGSTSWTFAAGGAGHVETRKDARGQHHQLHTHPAGQHAVENLS
jgi:hypothetical protein